MTVTTVRDAYRPDRPYRLSIGGELLPGEGTFETIDPSVGRPWAEIPQASKDDVDRCRRGGAGCVHRVAPNDPGPASGGAVANGGRDRGRRRALGAAAGHRERAPDPGGTDRGGIKDSGFGREVSAETLLEYSAPKVVNVNLAPARPPMWGRG